MSGGSRVMPPEVVVDDGGEREGSGSAASSSPTHATASETVVPAARTRALASALRIGRAQLDARRLAELPARCRELEAGLYNDEGDPTTLFDGLRYADVMRVAVRDAAVGRAIARLPETWRWADE